MITIITITFNNYDELVQTLDSIKNIPNTESVVINGGTCEKTRSFLLNYSGVSLSEKDYGISDAFNKGLALARGEAILFLNSGDVLINKKYINWANDIFTNQKEIDFTYSGIKIQESNGKLIEVEALNSEKRSLAKGMPFPHQTLIIRKIIFNKIGNFKTNLRFAMDFDLVLRMFKLGSRGKHYPQMTVLMDGSGVSSNNDIKVFFENYHVLKMNNRVSLLIMTRLIFSFILIFIKKSLYAIKLSGLVNLLKRYRHKINY